MQVFKAFFKIAKKHIPQAAIYVVVFLIIIFMMSFSSNNSGSSQFKTDSIDITIIDHDNSTLSRGIYDYLDKHHNIVKLKKNDAESLTDNLFYQRISYALTIPKGFEESFKTNGTLKMTHNMREDSASGFFVNRQLDSFLNSISSYITSGYSIDNAINETIKNIDNSPKVKSITFEEKSSSSNDIMFTYFQYMSYIFLMIFTISLVPILVTFHQEDLSARISCSATSARSRNVQLGIACVCYSLITWVLFVLLAAIVFKPANVFSDQGLLCILNSFVFALICTAITLLLSTFNIKDNALNLIANIIGLGMSFICGIFVPQWFLAPEVLRIGKFLPAYWYIKILNMITGWSGEKYSMTNYWKYIGIELIFLAAIFSVYLVCNKQRKKNHL